MKARAAEPFAPQLGSEYTADAQLRAFIDSLRARGAALTMRRYETACEHLLRECASKPLSTLTARDIQTTLSKLHARGMQARSLATTLSAWRAFFRYLSKADPVYSLDVFNGIRAPRAEKRLPNALTEVEAVRLMDHGVDEAVHADLATLARDQAMVELLYGCGMRVGELVALDVTDVMTGSGEIRVLGKGRKERVLPLGGAAERALSAWIAERPAMLRGVVVPKTQAALFLGARGDRVDATIVRRVLRARAQSAGVPSHVYPHRLRHSFASHLLQASGDLRAVQELMGHASIASTQVYTHLDFAHLAKVYDSAHPRARKRKP